MLDLGILAAFVLCSLYLGWSARRKASRSLTEYFLAGRSVSGWRAGLSMAATQFAADTPLLVMGLLAMGGVFSLWRLWIYGLAFLLMGFVLGAAWRRAGVLTDAELTMIRYSARGALTLRALKAVYYGTVINCVVLAFVLAAATRLFEFFLPWHEWLPGGVYGPLTDAVAATGLVVNSGLTNLPDVVATTNNFLSIGLMLLFVAGYSTTGGLRSVIGTDVLQLAIMLSGTALYAWYAVESAGGLQQLPAALEATYGADTAARFLSFSPPVGEAFAPFVVILGLQWFYQMNSDGTGYLAQRTMACRDDREARFAAIVFTITQIVVRSLLWLLIGIALLIVFPFDASAPATEALIAGREMVFAEGMDTLLPVGARGLMLTGMLAALASTIDTHMNWGASYWSNDLYKAIWVERIRGREANQWELVRVARLSTLVLIIIGLAIMVNLGSIQTAWQISLLFGAGTGAVLVLRWVWERVNLWCEIGSILVSLVLAPILIVSVDADWLRLLLMALVSTAVVIVAAFVMPGTEPVRLMAFYDRVRPPGWWRNTARGLNLDSRASRQALRRDVVAVIAAAISVYAWLVGLAQLLLQTTDPVFAISLLLIGTIVVPVWWRAVK
ncbi:MAG: Na+:solute symporter [Gammaproteobacteria bacterium]|nr:Na+:solute symporter [Gammaproteobacteria bacterium]